MKNFNLFTNQSSTQYEESNEVVSNSNYLCVGQQDYI